MTAALNPFDPTSLLSAFGTLGVFLVLFAETGLLVGFFLPGDSLLFTAGLLCATGPHLSLPWVLVAAAAGALIGAQVGYHIGARGGRALLDRTRKPKLHEAVERAQQLFERYGHGKAIVLARFLPIVRTVLNPVAGAVSVPPRVFLRWQVLGGLLWTVGLTVAGYVLGTSVPDVDRYLLPVIVLIVLVSLVPVGIEVVRARRAR
ncbi:DedA family protein [Umezawaea tangerina]|uniref:Membrane-associated protein n=1 Tax=Umezawaea tangerina TaxID=84725 RepID=A0A2T0T1F8_9PSEU|nr:DedA family protein [Umezawaea tangerina]PRY39502.1 membrane-associated protein [Umezawaea tangerina]